MECRVCGHDNSAEAAFCASCGVALVGVVQLPTPVTASFPSPSAPVAAVEYVGFWIRSGAAIVDSVVISLISSFFVSFNYTAGGFFGIFAPWLYHWLFIGLTGQTPGKMAFSIKVVDARLNQPTLKIAALREILGKFISTMALFLGFLWVAFDRNKQGWHDKIASTYVIKVVRVKSTG